MSTTTSPPPQGSLAGFNQQTPFDPYLPSTPDEEQLTQVSSSRNTPAPSSHLESHYSTESIDRPQYLSAESSGIGDSPLSDFTHTSNGMNTPNYQEQFPTLEGYGVQEFDDSILNFNYDLPVEDYSLDNSFAIPAAAPTSAPQQEEPPSATTTKTNSGFSRQSTGLANLSEHLMSPELTDMGSPDSNPEGPFHSSKLLGGGDMSRISSQSTAFDASQHHGQLHSQPTPAATGSSVDVTPDPSGGVHSFSAPNIHIQSYTRGDSPARVKGIKRSRAGSRSSSHLAAPMHDSSEDEKEDNEVPATGLRSGADPSGRVDAETLSADDIKAQQEFKAKSTEIGNWLSNSGAAGAPPDEPAVPVRDSFLKPAGRRIRSKSSSNPQDLHNDVLGFQKNLRAEYESKIPGPGKLINELSDDEYEESDYGSSLGAAPPSTDMNAEQQESTDQFPVFESNDPIPTPQDASPWLDPISIPSLPGHRAQPGSSNAAMMLYLNRSRDIETASRVATWGTTPRRMSDGDMERVFGSGGLLARLSISKDKSKSREDQDDLKREFKEFKDDIIQTAAKFLPKRALSNSKRKKSDASRPGSKDASTPEHGRKESLSKLRKESSQSSHGRHDSLGSSSIIERIPSVRRRPKSPGINTNVGGIAAGIANATQIGALGVNPKSPSSISSPVSKWDKLTNAARGRLSRHGSQEAQDLEHFQTHSAAQSRTSLASPPIQEVRTSVPAPQPADDDDVDSDEVAPEDSKGVDMEMKPSKDRIIPNFEGFKSNARDTNPRLDEWLVERLGQEQLRRYKKLVNFKVDHAKANEAGKCSSGHRCGEKGGEPVYFPAKAASKEPVHSHTGFSTHLDEDDADAEAVADGAVTEAQYPPGVPLPPVKRLPAEFECPLCFTLKKFVKPSDWSKHVHEDLQPFTCTFKNCPDPKSFKRKADWVRHENERHRQLEWWQCTEEGCQHLCYRRDNFVQHLVREHKLPEPKSKVLKTNNKPAVRGPAKGKPKGLRGDLSSVPPEDKVLYMVEVCRHETTKNPMDEACKFCGNKCNSFKKLTVHLARHMETLSLPVLDLVNQKDVTPDTIISPIEIKLSQNISPTDSQYPGNQIFPQPELIGGFTPVVTDTNFQTTYQTQGQGQWMQQQQSPPLDPGMQGGWIESNNMYTPSSQSGYNNMTMHHNSVPNPAYYNMSSQGSGMQGSYGQNYTMGQQNMGQRPNFSTPQYMSQQQHLNQNVPTSQADGMMGVQYGSGDVGAYSQGPGGNGLYGATMQGQRAPSGSPPMQGQQQGQFYRY